MSDPVNVELTTQPPETKVDGAPTNDSSGSNLVPKVDPSSPLDTNASANANTTTTITNTDGNVKATEVSGNVAQVQSKEQTGEDVKDSDGKEQELLRNAVAGVGDALSKVKKFSNLECIAFFIFIIIFCVMVTLSRGTDDRAYIQTAAIRSRLTLEKYPDGFNYNFDRQLQDTNQVMDIWNYLNNVALKILLTEGTMGQWNATISNNTLRYYPLGQTRLLGGVRFRQIRRKPAKCAIKEESFTHCWSSKEDTSDFSGNGLLAPYKYRSESELHDVSWRAKYGSYSGGGYVHDFPLNYTLAINQSKQLQKGDWIDRGTAFVAIDFNLYNPSTNFHTIGRIAFEMPTGGVFPYYEIKTWKFLRYADDTGAALATVQIIWVLFILGFTGMMAYEMHREGCSCSKTGYWGKTRWRILDVINYCFFYAAIFAFIANEAYRHEKSNDWKDIYQYRSFRKLQYLVLSETYILAFNGFLSFFKLFKYFSVNRRLKFFFTMLGKAGQDLLMFILVLVIFFLGFGFCGFMAFSSDVDDFRSMIFAFFNMIRFVVGDINYAALQLSSRTWGSVYYVGWSILMLLILTNVFIAILSEAYGETIEEMSDEDKLSLGLFGMRGAMTRLQKMFQNFTKLKIDELDEDGDGQLDAHELANKTGWTVEQAQQFIDEHDKDNDGKLSEKEWELLAKQIEEKEQQGDGPDTQLLAMGAALSPGRPSLIGKGVPQLSLQQFQHLNSQIGTIEELLRAQLHQTKAGSKALKEIEGKQKPVSVRKMSKLDSTESLNSNKED